MQSREDSVEKDFVSRSSRAALTRSCVPLHR
jgi:hypothetical protein